MAGLSRFVGTRRVFLSLTSKCKAAPVSSGRRAFSNSSPLLTPVVLAVPVAAWAGSNHHRRRNL